MSAIDRGEDSVSDRMPIFLGALAGAIVGGAAGYLLFTEAGRRLRDDLEPQLVNLLTELGRTRDAAVGAREAIAGSVDAVRDIGATLRSEDARPFGGVR